MLTLIGIILILVAFFGETFLLFGAYYWSRKKIEELKDRDVLIEALTKLLKMQMNDQLEFAEKMVAGLDKAIKIKRAKNKKIAELEGEKRVLEKALEQAREWKI